jgi:nuclear cap-binding protein subunit 1
VVAALFFTVGWNNLLTLNYSICEQPLKIPIISAVFLFANEFNEKVAKEMLVRTADRAQDALESGHWREFKLMLRFFACLQGIFEGDGIFPMLDDLFNKAADQQTASQDDVTLNYARK